MKLFISLAVATYVLIAGFTMGYLSPLYAARDCEFSNEQFGDDWPCGWGAMPAAMLAGMLWPLALPAELGRALAEPKLERPEDETR